MGAGGERVLAGWLELREGTFTAASWLMGPWVCVYRKADAFLSILFFFSSLYCFEGVHFILIFNQGTGGPVEGSCVPIYTTCRWSFGVLS